MVAGVEVRAARCLADVVGLFNGTVQVEPRPSVELEALLARDSARIDFGDVRGQESAKRALCIAAAGGHNALMIGPAGTGKTMMARALPGILPPLTPDEAVEVTRIYSSVGALPADRPLITARPVRTPHHTASATAIIGGGVIPRPGDVSLAHRGVLFLDEMPEFARHVLETLRQPLEDGCVTIARTWGSARFPARFMLIGAMNPTPRGGRSPDDVSHRAMERYLAKLSGPLIDRIDLHVEVPAVPLRALQTGRRGTDSRTMREHVAAARARQRRRQGALINAELTGRDLDRYAPLATDAANLLGQAMTEMGLSARSYDRIRRVARTIADLDGAGHVADAHIAEAVQYRLLDRVI